MNDELPKLYNRRADDINPTINYGGEHLDHPVTYGTMITPLTVNSSPNVPVKLTASNPKIAIGSKKIPMNLWSPLASAYGAIGLLNGKKYGFGNYKANPVVASSYIAATYRHLSAWCEGQENDADGVPHLSGVLANIAILLEARSLGTLIDDRTMQGGYLKEVAALEEIAQKINELHKDTYYHYTIKDNPETSIK